MSLEIKLDDRIAKVELLSENGSQITIMVDDQTYEIDMLQVENGVYSVLYKGRSYNVELIATDNAKKYSVNTFYHSYEAEIIDAEAKYLQAKKSMGTGSTQSTLLSPMPGKVVKVPVSVGQAVTKGETVIIISAMKMESEYKAMKDGVVGEIFVKEGEIIDGNQPLIYIE